MSRGGIRQGAGRKKGQVATHRKLANEVTVKAVGDGLTPLAYLLSILRDEEAPRDARVDAAKAAAPYVHPKLAQIEHSGNQDKPLAMIVQSGVPRVEEQTEQVNGHPHPSH